MEVGIELTDNPFDLPPEAMFQMAARINKKRSFLFVSKVLGKHLPVNPFVSLMSGAILGLLYYKHAGYAIDVDQEEMTAALQDASVAEKVYRKMKSDPLQLTDPTLFIGFAETATALGHSMFDVFAGPTKYMHTTRDEVTDIKPSISFEEEHSHATAHRCYTLDPQFLQGAESIVLVDDEITTGKTALNIIRDLHAKSQVETYIVATLLDWRSEEDQDKFKLVERELGITITCLSVLQGKIAVRGGPVVRDSYETRPIAQAEPEILHHFAGTYFQSIPFTSIVQEGERNDQPYLKETGRFGLSGADILEIDDRISRCAREISAQRRGQNTLCMGTGEFMYLPMRIAAEMGEGVAYQSSTRSPIHPYDQERYAIRHAYSFQSLEDHAVTNYFYNIQGSMYDEVFIFVERMASIEMLKPMIQALHRTDIPMIHFVHFSNS